MDTIDLNLIASSDYTLSKSFKGVYACDELPKLITTYPASFIVNTDKAKYAGKHWIAMYFENQGLCDIFDSYGMTPFGEIYSFASDNAAVVQYNNLFLQNPISNLCGAYCLYFLHYRCRGYSLNAINGPPLVEYRWEENDALVRDTIRLLIED